MTLLCAQRVVARAISAVLSPPLAGAGMSILLISGFRAPMLHRAGWLGICLLFVTCLPTLYVGLLVARKEVDGFFIAIRSRRQTPLLVSSASCFAGFLLLRATNAPPSVTAFLLSYAMLGLVAAGMNARWKISLHAAGVCGLLAMLQHLPGTSAIYWLPLPIAVSWARIVLGAHSIPQVAAGGGMGYLVVRVVAALYTSV